MIKEEELADLLQRLQTYQGVWRKTLYGFLGAELRGYWGIDFRDDTRPDIVRAKVVWHIRIFANKYEDERHDLTRIAYNIEPEPTLIASRSINARINWANEHRGLGFKYEASRRREGPLWSIAREFARQILQPNYKLRQPTERQINEIVNEFDEVLQGTRPNTVEDDLDVSGEAFELSEFRETPYIARPSLHKAVLEAVQIHSIAMVIGDSANGKTRLAQECARLLAGDAGRVLSLRADDANALAISVASELPRFAIETSNRSTEELKRELCALVAMPGKHMVVVLGGVSHWSTIKEVVEAAKGRPLLVTGAADVFTGWIPHGVVLVEPLTEAESVDLIQRLMPDVDNEDAVALSCVLGGKPLAIEQACGYISADGLISVQTYLRLLDRNAAKVLRLPGASRNFTAVCQSTLEAVAVDDPDAALLLELIAFVGDAPIPTQPLARAFALTQGMSFNDGDAYDYLAHTIRALRQRHLIYYEAGAVTIHTLSQAVFRGIMSERSSAVCRGLYIAFGEEAVNISPGAALDARQLLIIPHVVKILEGLSTEGDATTDLVCSLSFGRVANAIMQGLRQTGDLRAVSALLGHLQRLAKSLDQSEEDTLLAYFAVVRLGFSAGILTRREYIDEVDTFLGKRKDGMLELKGHAVLEFGRALLLGYRYDDLGTFLMACSNQFAELRRQGKVFDDPAYRGNLYALAGDAASGIGRWKHATTCYEQAIQQFALRPTEANCLQGKLRVMARVADQTWKEGRLKDAALLVRDAIKMSTDVKAVLNDLFTDALLLHMQGRTVSKMYLVAGQPLIERNGIALDGSRADIDVCISMLHKAADMYRRAAAFRQANDADYDAALYCAVHGAAGVRESRDRLHRVARVASGMGEDRLVDQCRLTAIKLNVLEGRTEAGDLDESYALAERFVSEYRDPYQQAGALITAYVVAVLTGAPAKTCDVLRVQIDDVYEDIETDLMPTAFLSNVHVNFKTLWLLVL